MTVDMKLYNTIATPRYSVESVRGDFFDVFSKRKNAIKSAIRFASTYPGQTFVVVKKVNLKSKVIFSFKIDSQVDFEDLQEFYRSMIEVYQSKLDKTRFWRKSDGSDN